MKELLSEAASRFFEYWFAYSSLTLTPPPLEMMTFRFMKGISEGVFYFDKGKQVGVSVWSLGFYAPTGEFLQVMRYFPPNDFAIPCPEEPLCNIYGYSRKWKYYYLKAYIGSDPPRLINTYIGLKEEGYIHFQGEPVEGKFKESGKHSVILLKGTKMPKGWPRKWYMWQGFLVTNSFNASLVGSSHIDFVKKKEEVPKVISEEPFSESDSRKELEREYRAAFLE